MDSKCNEKRKNLLFLPLISEGRIYMSGSILTNEMHPIVKKGNLNPPSYEKSV